MKNPKNCPNKTSAQHDFIWATLNYFPFIIQGRPIQKHLSLLTCLNWVAGIFQNLPNFFSDESYIRTSSCVGCWAASRFARHVSTYPIFLSTLCFVITSTDQSLFLKYWGCQPGQNIPIKMEPAAVPKTRPISNSIKQSIQSTPPVRISIFELIFVKFHH